MGQVNVNPSPQPYQRPRQWTTVSLSIFIGILIALIVEALILLAYHRNGRDVTIAATGPSATQTAQAQAAPTQTALAVALATETALAHAAPATQTALAHAAPATQTALAHAAPATLTALALAAPTATPAAAAPTPTPVAGPPSNPTAMQTTQGSCTRHTMSWRWSGAKNASGYDVAIYNPATGAMLAQNTTLDSSFTQAGTSGQTLALKVRARNAAGTAPGYFSPPDTAHIPPLTTNPTAIQVMTSTSALAWTWFGAQGATGYEVIAYHYSGSGLVQDQHTTVTQPHFSMPPRDHTTFYLKVRAQGPCAPSAFYIPLGASSATG